MIPTPSPLNEFRASGTFRDLRREFQRERRDAFRTEDIDLLPIVRRSMVVGVEAGEEVDRRNPPREKIEIIAASRAGTLTDDVQSFSGRLRRRFEIRFHGR